MNDFLGLVQALQLTIKALLMYTAAHPKARTSLESLAEKVQAWLKEKPSLHIAASQNKLFLDGVPFEGTHIHLSALARQLTERQISGFILLRGVTSEELGSLLELFILKPARIEEAGGAAAVLAKKALPHVQLSQTQYQEIMEGDGGAGNQGGPGTRTPEGPPAGSGKGAPFPGTAEAAGSTGPPADSATVLAALAASMRAGGGQALPAFPSAALPAPSPAFDPGLLARQWEEQFAHLPRPSFLDSLGFTRASLGFLGGTPLSIGMGDGFPPAHQVEGLRRALLDLPPETLLSVVAGQDSLPSAPDGMRLGFQALASQAFGRSAGTLMVSGAPWENLKDAIFLTLRYASQQPSMLAALEAELQSLGAGTDILERFRDILQQLEWESLTLEEQLRLALDHGKLWTLTLEQRLIFLRRLLEEGRFDPFITLLEQALDRLGSEDPVFRENAARTLRGIAAWMEVPGLPMEAESLLLQGLVAHFGWEPHLHIHALTTGALELILASLVNRSEPGQALSLLHQLVDLCGFQASESVWRQAALDGLRAGLSAPELLRKVVELLQTATPETMLNELIPFLEAAGDAACKLLVDILGEEPDRKRRGRLIEGIRGLGEPALPALYRGLDSPAWYLVRNTLNLLGDMGDAGALPAVERCLSHPDGRVKRAAVRTLWKVCGPAAVPALLALLPLVDPETQMEVVFALGQVRSVQAVPVLATFAQERRTPQPLRLRACEILGQIGGNGAIAALAELAHRRGRFFSTAEPTEVRLAACRALLALHLPEAVEALRKIVAAEPWNKERALLQQVLDNQAT